jgi:hypothetical protein
MLPDSEQAAAAAEGATTELLQLPPTLVLRSTP